MAYKEIILHSLYMPSYFLGAFTEYPILKVSTGYSPPQAITFNFFSSIENA